MMEQFVRTRVHLSMVKYGLQVGFGLSVVPFFWVLIWMALTDSAFLGLGSVAFAVAANKC